METLLSIFPYLLWIGLILIGLIFRKNKIVFILQLVYIFLMFAGSRGLADETIYINRYNEYLSLAKVTETLFTFYLQLAHFMNLDYYGWLISVALIYTIVLGIVCKLRTENHNFVLSFMILFSLIIDATQLRQTIAMIFGWLALLVLTSHKVRWYKIVISIILILFAFLNHSSTILYAAFLPCFFIKNNKKFSLYIVVLFLSTLLIINVPTLFELVTGSINEQKSQQVLARTFNLQSGILRIIFVFSISAISIVPYYISKYFFAEEPDSLNKLIIKCNFSLLFIILLIPYVVDFYRIMQVLILFNLIALSKYSVKKQFGTIYYKNVVCSLIGFVFIFYCLYNLILSNSNIDSVYHPFFLENVYLFQV